MSFIICIYLFIYIYFSKYIFIILIILFLSDKNPDQSIKLFLFNFFQSIIVV